ncbi:MAG: hypothetical protein K6G86_07770 [Bacteroidales bacterium]|nr:hypothetical protein [Bacteroidales bacterium]
MIGAEVKIGGKSYPCRMTMGAMLRFKRITGREVSEANMGSVSDLAILFYCCTASACNADGVPFDMNCDTFCDRIDPESMDAMSASISGADNSDPDGTAEQKKSD